MFESFDMKKEKWKQKMELRVEKSLPLLVKEQEGVELVIMYRDSFAADYQPDELYLMGAAIKYCLDRGKEVRIVPIDNHMSGKFGDESVELKEINHENGSK